MGGVGRGWLQRSPKYYWQFLHCRTNYCQEKLSALQTARRRGRVKPCEKPTEEPASEEPTEEPVLQLSNRLTTSSSPTSDGRDSRLHSLGEPALGHLRPQQWQGDETTKSEQSWSFSRLSRKSGCKGEGSSACLVWHDPHLPRATNG